MPCGRCINHSYSLYYEHDRHLHTSKRRKTSCTTIGTTGARCAAVTATLWEDWLLAFLSLAWLLLFTSQILLVGTCSCPFYLPDWHSVRYLALPVQVIRKASMVVYRALPG